MTEEGFMAGKTWIVNLDGVNHKIELEHGTFSGKRVIKLDGQVIEESQKLMDSGTDHFFKIRNHLCAIHIHTGGLRFKYDLSINGVSAETGQPTKLMDGTPTALFTTETVDLAERVKIEKQMKNGANWFFWIAGLSLINTIIFLFDGSVYFVVGLGITQVVDGLMYYAGEDFGPGIAPFVQVVGLAINIVIMGIFVFFGFQARKARKWAFITGLIFYGLDVLLLIWAGDLFSILFHALALFGLFQGLRAAGKLATLEPFGGTGVKAEI
jgi:hypothetical protein